MSDEQTGRPSFAAMLRALLSSPGREDRLRDLSAFAKQLEVSPSFVRHWLRDSKVPSTRTDYISSIANVLSLTADERRQLEEAYEASLRRHAQRVQKARTTKRRMITRLGGPLDVGYRSAPLEQLPPDLLQDQLPKFPTVVRSEEKIMRVAIKMVSEARTISPHSRTIYFTFNGAHNVLSAGEELDQWWTHAVRGALERGWDVCQLIRLDANLQRSFEVVDSIRTYLGATGTYQPYYFKHYGTLPVPDGLCIVPGVGALVFFATKQAEHVDAALFICESDQVDMLIEHVERFRLTPGVVDELLRSHPRDNGRSTTDFDFSTANATYELEPGPIMVVRDAFSFAARPYTFFDDGATFLTGCPASERSRWQTLFRRRYETLVQRRQIYGHRDLCPKRGVTSFASNGTLARDDWRTLDAARDPTYTPTERWQQLSHLIDLLQQPNSKYELALLDDDEARKLLHVHWEAIGESAVIVQSWVPNARGEEQEVHLEITEPTIVRAFQAYGEELWNKEVAAHNRERTWVAWWLGQCRTELEQRYPQELPPRGPDE